LSAGNKLTKPSLRTTSCCNRLFSTSHTSRNCNTTMRMQLQILSLELPSNQAHNQTDTDSSTGRMPMITRSRVIDEERGENQSDFKHQKERPATTPPRTRHPRC
jgi:hypothetical protein